MFLTSAPPRTSSSGSPIPVTDAVVFVLAACAPSRQAARRYVQENSAICTILAIEAPTLLRYAWPNVGDVTFELRTHGSDIMLTLTHARAPSASVVLGVSAGWHSHLDLLGAAARAVLGPLADATRSL